MNSLALSMIVRNAGASLRACLESARALVDEIVIADTGSTDDTQQIAEEYGARVFSIPWENDFALARNRALEAVSSEWVLVLDADEVLDPAAARFLPRLLERKELAGYTVPIWNYVLSFSDRLWEQPAKPNPGILEAARQYPAYVEHQNVRLFRRLPDVRFEGRVHETVGTSILKVGGKLGSAGFVIHHFGLTADPESRARKNQLYRDLGRLKIQEMPQDAQAHFELGIVELDNFGNVADALSCFERAHQLNPRLGVAWFFSGVAYTRLGEYARALDALKQAERCGIQTSVLPETQGDASYNLGKFEAAGSYYSRAMAASGGAASVQSKLGLAEVRQGFVERGMKRLRHAIEHEPNTGELYDRLITAAVWLGRLDEAAQIAERKLLALGPDPQAILRAATIRSQQGNWIRAAELACLGLNLFPDSQALLQVSSEILARLSYAK